MRPARYRPRNGAGKGPYRYTLAFDERLPPRKGKRRKAILWGHIRNRIGSDGWNPDFRCKMAFRSWSYFNRWFGRLF